MTPDDSAVDPRIWGRRYRGPHPAWWGALVAAIILVGVYLAFTKELPWSSPGYTLSATFENATTLRETAPVRIAGIKVGEVISVEPAGEAAKVTFTVSDDGRPIHSDAEIEIRPRLFLEGNFFLDVRPGSPSAPELEDGQEIPVTQTATAVQLDELLTALQEPQRRGLQRLLEGFGTALSHEPSAAEDLTQDTIVQGESAAESLNDAFQLRGSRRPGHRDRRGRARRPGAARPRADDRGDGSRLPKARHPRGRARRPHHEPEHHAGAFASESENLSRSIELLGPTLSETEISLRALNDALPPLRALAIESQSRHSGAARHDPRSEPWLEQTAVCSKHEELGGTAKLLKECGSGLGSGRRRPRSTKLFPRDASSPALCTTQNLVPTADTPITSDAAGFNTGEPNFQELFYGATQIVERGPALRRQRALPAPPARRRLDAPPGRESRRRLREHPQLRNAHRGARRHPAGPARRRLRRSAWTCRATATTPPNPTGPPRPPARPT